MRPLALPLLALASLLASGCSGPAATPGMATVEAAVGEAVEPGRLVADDFEASGSVVASDGLLSCSPADALRECESFVFTVSIEGDGEDVRDGLFLDARIEWGLPTSDFRLEVTNEKGGAFATAVKDPNGMGASVSCRILSSGTYHLYVRPGAAVGDGFKVTARFTPAPGQAAE